MNLLKVENSSVWTDLQQKISSEIEPWLKTADKVKFVWLFLEYVLFSEAPADIDVFNVENNEREETMLCTSRQGMIEPHESEKFQDVLKQRLQFIQELSASSSNKTALRINLELLKGNTSVKTFSYERRNMVSL